MTGVEEWRPVADYPGVEVSSLGRVRSWRVPGHRGRRRAEPRICAPTPSQKGYLRVGLDDRGPQPVHVLVARAFIGPPPFPGAEVRHLNDDKSNCALANLAYGTRRENCLDAVRNGRNAKFNQTHCINGHEFDEANTPRGHRVCRACVRGRGVVYYWRKRGQEVAS